MEVPGSRFVFDNPDTIYFLAPIESGVAYEIHGKHNPVPPIDENFSLLNTTVNLSGRDLVTSQDGSFTITVDKDPANGRKNHIQAVNGGTLIIRNTINDWANQTFDHLSLVRIDPPKVPPKTLDDIVDQVAVSVAAGLPIMSSIQLFDGKVNAQPINTLPPITVANPTLISQKGSYSAWQIDDDEALVVTVNLGGAKYFTCPVYNKWQITTDYINHTSSLNNAQAVPNSDGTYTFVISVKDPGVYNWVDTVGMK